MTVSSLPMFGSPPHVPEVGWNETPIVGLESIPIMTTSSPAETWGSIVAATVFARRRQWARKSGVSAWSRTHQNRRTPPNASSGHGICRITQPRSRRRSMTGSHIAAVLQPPWTFEFWLRRQWARKATRASRAPSLEVEQHLAELAGLLHPVERGACLIGREDAVDERHDPARREVGDDLAAEGLHRKRLLLQRPGAQHRPDQPRTPAHQRAERELGVRAGARADDHDPSLHRERGEIGLEVRRADELDHDVRAAELLGAGLRGRSGRSPPHRGRRPRVAPRRRARSRAPARRRPLRSGPRRCRRPRSRR